MIDRASGTRFNKIFLDTKHLKNTVNSIDLVDLIISLPE